MCDHDPGGSSLCLYSVEFRVCWFPTLSRGNLFIWMGNVGTWRIRTKVSCRGKTSTQQFQTRLWSSVGRMNGCVVCARCPMFGQERSTTRNERIPSWFLWFHMQASKERQKVRCESSWSDESMALWPSRFVLRQSVTGSRRKWKLILQEVTQTQCQAESQEVMKEKVEQVWRSQSRWRRRLKWTGMLCGRRSKTLGK